MVEHHRTQQNCLTLRSKNLDRALFGSAENQESLVWLVLSEGTSGLEQITCLNKWTTEVDLFKTIYKIYK